MSYTCASCKVYACCEKDKDENRLPKNCPMRDGEYLKEIFEEYKDPEINRFYVATKSSRHPGSAAEFCTTASVCDRCMQKDGLQKDRSCVLRWLQG